MDGEDPPCLIPFHADSFSAFAQNLLSKVSEQLEGKVWKYSTVQYSTVQYSTVEYSTVQYTPKLAARLIGSTERSKGWGLEGRGGGNNACNFVSAVLPQKFLDVAVYRL
jgi:hypothetical protein